MQGIYRNLLIAVTWLALNVESLSARSCPYCPPTDATLSEKLAESDVACVVKFTGSDPTAKFEVVKPLPNKDRFKKGEQILTDFDVTAAAGDQFLLLGQLVEQNMQWKLPIPLDELWSVYTYLIKAPPIESPRRDRLVYFLKFLDNENTAIANDAFSEFAQADFSDVAAVTASFSRRDVRRWLEDPNPQVDVRRAFYGMVLGLCGNDDDAEFLEKKIFAPIDPEKNRLGIEGMMGGFLLLRGQAGLEELIEKKIDSVPEDLPNDDPRLVDLNALRMTLSFLWDYRRSQFTEDSLRAAMRRFLRRSEFADLAVVDLSRWKDWASLDQLIAGYGKEPWDTTSAKEKVVAFALSCRRDAKVDSDAPLPEHAVKAQKFLDSLDPAIVDRVRRTLGGKAPAPRSPAQNSSQ